MTFDCMNIWRIPYYIYKISLVPIGLQLFKWGHFHIFNLSYNLTSNDLWPWYITFDLINKWGFPYCIYDPTLVEIHQWKLEPNVNLFSQQTSTDNNNSGQSDPYVSFLLRQATQIKKMQKNHRNGVQNRKHRKSHKTTFLWLKNNKISKKIIIFKISKVKIIIKVICQCGIDWPNFLKHIFQLL